MEVAVTPRDFSITSAQRVRVELNWLEIMTRFRVSILFCNACFELGGSMLPVASCLHFYWLLLVSLEVVQERAESTETCC